MSTSTVSHRDVIQIDTNGDVNLVLDDGTLKVSRKALCLSSTVFQAMLGDHSNFMEASQHAVGSDGIRNVHLEDDDYVATTILMKAIHHQNHTIPTKVSFDQLKDIAVICDKYDLRNCLLPWCQLWSQPYIDRVEQDGYESWLFMSIAFRNEGLFAQITKRLVLNTAVSSSRALSCGNGSDFIEGVPDEIIEQILSQRANTMDSLNQLLKNLMHRLLYNKAATVCSLPEKSAQCDTFNLGCLMQAFPWLCDSTPLDNSKSSTIIGFIERIRQIGSYGRELTYHEWGRSNNRADHADCGLERLLLPQALEIFESVQGLVLPPHC